MNENDLKIVRITNIADFDFTGELGARYGGRDFFVPAGGSLLAPKTVGDHLATHLARQILLRNSPVRDEGEVDGKGSSKALWDDKVIENLKNKILSEVYEEEKPKILSEADRLAEKVAELNKAAAIEEDEIEDGNVDASGITITETDNSDIVYKDKAQVIAELNKRGVKFNAREKKVDLERLLSK